MKDIDIERIRTVLQVLDERQKRLYLAAEAKSLGYGGISEISKLTGISRNTIKAGEADYNAVIDGTSDMIGGSYRIRKEGGGRKTITEIHPELETALLKLVDEESYGNPENPLRWTTKSTRNLSNELKSQGFEVSHSTIATLLIKNGFSLQGNSKMIQVGKPHPDRNEQFQFINDKAKEYIDLGLPVVSIDCKKKEKVGKYSNKGRDWHEKGNPILTEDHDFGKDIAAPYGVYDIQNNEAFVNVGISHDTAEFAAHSILEWWLQMGSSRYPEANKILVTADGGGSNGSRNRLWKMELQKLSDVLGIDITVSHFPPGASKWNKIEHRLFSAISKNWANQPLESYEVIVNLIGSTTAKSKTGNNLKVKAQLDTNEYIAGIKIPDELIGQINLSKASFHGEWNYMISPSLFALSDIYDEYLRSAKETKKKKTSD